MLLIHGAVKSETCPFYFTAHLVFFFQRHLPHEPKKLKHHPRNKKKTHLLPTLFATPTRSSCYFFLPFPHHASSQFSSARSQRQPKAQADPPDSLEHYISRHVATFGGGVIISEKATKTIDSMLTYLQQLVGQEMARLGAAPTEQP